MRERLFRGRRMYSEEWIYSTTIFDKGDSVYMPRPNTNYIITSHADIVGDIWQIECKRPDCFYRVDPSTVGQYTGLTDKNGKKIFEGDIVKITHVSTGDERVTAVMYGSGLFGVKHEDRLIPSIIPLRAYDCYSQIEIIGNIHDNPELLEDKP